MSCKMWNGTSGGLRLCLWVLPLLLVACSNQDAVQVQLHSRMPPGPSLFHLGIVAEVSGVQQDLRYKWFAVSGSCTPQLFGITPWRLWRAIFRAYVQYSRFRHRNAPGGTSAARDFIARRTQPDLAAIRHRLALIAGFDPREIAMQAPCPTFLLSGFVDPIVPRRPVLRWLRKHCPAFSGDAVIWPADHTVLATEPAKALAQIRHWVESSRAGLYQAGSSQRDASARSFSSSAASAAGKS